MTSGQETPDTPPATRRRLHVGVQISWFVLLAAYGLLLVLRFDGDCGADSCWLFQDRGDVAEFVLIFGGAVWAAGAIVIALFTWAMRTARRRDQRAGIA